MKTLIFVLLATAAWCQHTPVTIEDNQTITGTKTFTGSTTIGLLCRSSQGEIDVVACYRADPTGKGDSTAALNAAFSNSSKATRYIPAGTYKISGTLNVDTRYRVLGAANTTTIQAAVGFRGTMANVVSTTAQSSVILGGMEGLFFDCQGNASVGVLYGGSDIYKTYGYRTTDTVMHNCTTAGSQVGANAWLLEWINVGFQGNGGDGLQVLDQDNMGEDLNCHGCSLSNNGGNGLTMLSATITQHDFHCYSCAFDTNGLWAIQNQTATSGDSVITLDGSYIFQQAKWIKNFGRMTINGAFFNDGDDSGILGYLIDNEGYLATFGGRWVNQGKGTVFNRSQSGFTTCLATIGAQSACNTYVDPTGNTSGLNNLILTGQLTANRLLQTKANTYAGKCTMSGSTVCTFTTAAGFKDYVSYVSLDQASTPPVTAISANCSLSGTTATVRAGVRNSLTWDCIFVGNPF